MASGRRVQVEGVDAALAELARQIRADLPTLLRVFAEEAVIDVRAQWPVATGRSRDSLRVLPGPPVSIEVPVEYASFIHEKGLRGPTWMVRIVTYLREHTDEIGRRAARRLAAR